MKKIISHYFCIADIGFNETNNTDLYYYSGEFIDKSNARKRIAELSAITRLEIELRLAAIVKKKPLKYLQYNESKVGVETHLGSGYMIDKDGCLLMLYSQNRIEVFDINFLNVKPKKLYQCLLDGKLSNEILNLRSCAVLVCAEQHFEITL